MLIMGMFGTPAARCGPYSGQRLNEGSTWGPGYRRGEDDRKRLVVDGEAAGLSGLVRTLRDYSPEDETRQIPKMQNRLYLRTKKSSVVLRNGLISLLDQTFPGINTLFDSQPKRSNGHFKWVASPRPFAPPPARRHTMD